MTTTRHRIHRAKHCASIFGAFRNAGSITKLPREVKVTPFTHIMRPGSALLGHGRNSNATPLYPVLFEDVLRILPVYDCLWQFVHVKENFIRNGFAPTFLGIAQKRCKKGRHSPRPHVSSLVEEYSWPSSLVLRRYGTIDKVIHHFEDHPTASNPGDPVSLLRIGLSDLYVGELTPGPLTTYDPWDDPPSRGSFEGFSMYTICRA